MIEATRACELGRWENAISLEVLAAAKAEVGDFDEAVRLQEKALVLASDDPKDRAQGETWLALYRAKKPNRPDAKP